MEIIRGKLTTAQKTVIYGPEGIGKSSFASQFPDALFIDTEGSTKHLDVARTPAPSSWTMLLNQVVNVRANPSLCKTLVLDTADWAEQLCSIDVCARAQKKGIEDFGYGKGYIYLAEEFCRLLNLLEEIIRMGVNVVITAHAQMRKFEQPDELGAYDRWELKLQKKTAPLLKEWADIVLFANYKTFVVNVDGQGAEKGKNKARGGKRVMYTTHHPCWDAKNRHDLPEELDLDFAQIAHCIPSFPTHPATTANTQPPAPVPAPSTDTHAPQTAAKQMTMQAVAAASSTAPKAPLLSGIPQALADLMAIDNITVTQIQDAVTRKGYYPANTPIANYDQQFIDGVLIGAWAQVKAMIYEDGFTVIDDSEDLPF